MESVLKADIFFFISSISVVIITAVLLVIGFYFIRLMRNFYKISKILKNYAKDTEASLKELGNEIRQSPLFTFIFGKEKKKKSEEEKYSGRKII